MTIQKGSNEERNFIQKSFDYWEKYPFSVKSLITILPVTLYYLGYMSAIRENTGSFIGYAAALITLNGVFLTLLVTLKASPIFERLKKYFPYLHDYLYTGLKKQIVSCIIFSMANLAIATVGPISNIWIIIPGIIIWSYLLVDVSLGALYTLKVVTDLAINDEDKRKPMA
ncbi:hypothetical protein [Lysinibacillus sp. F5]|uniref:hypothetical protein n=1 Tax=Lysinibacillus sp. F5 TaxID=1700846 RepID=UPI0007389F99|nr:hypothetical protein [Lysinibacillus sp. F5]KUF29976.1 hypothetical protein AK833_18095 [Lysinibacillus sp. F5]